MAMYFVESEQIPTACALGVLVDRDQSVTGRRRLSRSSCCPAQSEDLIDKIEAGVRRVGSVSHALLAAGWTPRACCEEVLSDFQLEVLETHPVEYRCYCSRERVYPSADQHGTGGAVLPHRGAGTGRPHLPVLRQGLPLLKGGAGGAAVLYVTPPPIGKG